MADQERRQFPRIKLITKVTHVRGDFFHYYYSRDLSMGGMFLETREPFPIGRLEGTAIFGGWGITSAPAREEHGETVTA